MSVVGEAAEIPWDANFFTHAISVESAYYWPDPARGLREIFRVLREGGSVWILINFGSDVTTVSLPAQMMDVLGGGRVGSVKLDRYGVAVLSDR